MVQTRQQQQQKCMPVKFVSIVLHSSIHALPLKSFGCQILPSGHVNHNSCVKRKKVTCVEMAFLLSICNCVKSLCNSNGMSRGFFLFDFFSVSNGSSKLASPECSSAHSIASSIPAFFVARQARLQPFSEKPMAVSCWTMLSSGSTIPASLFCSRSCSCSSY